jgi:solute carrier family 13 (sodium-dependent dicarboxylate transporter), member 2/3/5
MIMGIGIKNSGLNKRFALRSIAIIGTDPKWLLLWMMVLTSFLSLWVSNIAITSIVMPLAISVVEEILHIKDRYKAECKLITG